MRQYIGQNFSSVYRNLGHDLRWLPDRDDTSPRGMKINEISNVYLEIHNPLNSLFHTAEREPSLNYLAGELLWYFSGRRDLDFISKYSKFWTHIANPDSTLNSAYGYQLWNNPNQENITEWEWAKKSLIEDKDSRQAIIRFNKPDVSFDGVKDFVCTLNGVFQIRGNQLSLTINMRSSDYIRGLTYDVPFFGLLISAMKYELRHEYPDLENGYLAMLLNSSHLYEEHFDLVGEMLHDQLWDSPPMPEYDENLINVPVEDIVKTPGELAHWIKEHS